MNVEYYEYWTKEPVLQLDDEGGWTNLSVYEQPDGLLLFVAGPESEEFALTGEHEEALRNFLNKRKEDK